MMKNIMKINIIVLGSFWCVIQLAAGLSTTSTLSVTRGDNTILVCDVAGTFIKPEWRGPPSNGIYAIENSLTLNPARTAVSEDRLTYNSNERDLDLATVADSDAGDYQCTTSKATPNGDHTITLDVTEPSTTTTPTTTTTTTPTTTTTTPTTTTTTPTTTTTTTPTTTTTTTTPPTTTTITPTTTTTTPTTKTTTTTTPATTTITLSMTTTTTTPATTSTVGNGNKESAATTVIIVLSTIGVLLVGLAVAIGVMLVRRERKSHSENHGHNEKRPKHTPQYHNNVSRINGSQYGYGQEGKIKLNPVYNRQTNVPAYHGHHHHYYQDRAGKMQPYPYTMTADRYPAKMYLKAQPRFRDYNGLYSLPTVHPGYARAQYRSNEWPVNGSTLVRNHENYVIGDYSSNW